MTSTGDSIKHLLLVIIACLLVTYGFLRLIHKPTLPSYRLIEVGIVLMAYVLLVTLRSGRLSYMGFMFLKSRKWFEGDYIFLLIVLLLALLYRMVWFIFVPYPIGSDTYKYLAALENIHKDPSYLMSLTLRGFDILPMTLLWIFYELFSFRFIYTVLIPSFSAFSIIPFYLILKHFYNDANTVRLATILFAFSTLHMRLILDLYRQTIAYFFMLWAFYYILTEKSRFPWRALVFFSATWLSHQAILVTLFLTLVVFALLRRNRELLIRLFMIIFIGLVSGIALMSYIHILCFTKPAVLKSFSYRLLHPMFLDPEMSAYFYKKIHLTIELFEWMLALFLLSLIYLTKLLSYKRKFWKEGDAFFFTFFVVVIFLVLQALYPIVWPEPDRWGLTLDIPLAIFAAQTILSLNFPTEGRKIFFVAVCIFWSFVDSLTFSILYLTP